MVPALLPVSTYISNGGAGESYTTPVSLPPFHRGTNIVSYELGRMDGQCDEYSRATQIPKVELYLDSSSMRGGIEVRGVSSERGDYLVSACPHCCS